MTNLERHLEGRSEPSNPEEIALKEIEWIRGQEGKEFSLLNHVHNTAKERTKNKGDHERFADKIIASIAKTLATSVRERMNRGFSVELSILFAFDTANIRSPADRRGLKTEVLLEIGRYEGEEARKTSERLEKMRKKMEDAMVPGRARGTRVSKKDEFDARRTGWMRRDDQIPEEDK